MADATLEQVKKLVNELPPEEQHRLAQNILSSLETQGKIKSKRNITDVLKILDETRGAWSKGKTLEEIDQEIRALREQDWSRD